MSTFQRIELIEEIEEMAESLRVRLYLDLSDLCDHALVSMRNLFEGAVV